MLRWFLIFALLTPAWGQTEGRLIHFGEGKVQLEGGQPTPALGPAYEQMSKAGLGSRWQVWLEGDHISRAVSLGKDTDVQAALASLANFAHKVADQDFTGARGLLSTAMAARTNPSQLQDYWQPRWLSPAPEDWTLQKWTHDQVRIQAVVMVGSAGQRNNKNYRAQTTKANLILVRQGSAWVVDSW
jgi:hypothetical protein